MELARTKSTLDQGELEDDERKEPIEPRKSNSTASAEAMRVRRERSQGAGDVVPSAPAALYEARLGQLLGPALYQAVSKLITLDKLASYARSGLESGLGELGAIMKDIDPNNAAEVDRAVTAMKETLGPQAAAYVEANGAAFQQSLQGFVDANPIAIVLVALLAAAAAVAADMDIPELKHTFRVREGLDVELAAKLGSLRNIAVERIQARIEYASGPLKASAAASYEPENKRLGADLGVDYAVTNQLDLYARGRWTEDIENGNRIDPGENSIRGGMRWRPGKNMSVEAYGEMDKERGAGAGISFIWSF